MEINQLITATDPELNGRVSHALHSGQDFSYWLALVGPWANERPKITQDQAEETSQQTSELPLNYYRHSALSASLDDVDKIKTHSQLLHCPQSAGFRLWQSMHPDPLSLHNDAKRIDDEILENCELHVRERFRSNLNSSITPDPTLLESIIPSERQMLA